MRNVNLIIDLQFGSTGKGLIAGYMAERDMPDLVINANMPNAGHTYINDAGRTWIHKVIPNGIVSPKLKAVGLGPQSVFSVDRLMKEVMDSIDLLKGKKLFIHKDAIVLDESHAKTERESLSGISSTMQGSAAASVSKMARNPEDDHRAISSATLAYAMDALFEHGVSVQLVDSIQWTLIIKGANRVLAEGAQGYSLGMNAGFWPYCTSRDCTPARFMADMGIPLGSLYNVIGTARVHPIRVGSTPDGYSGDVYKDQIELDWSDIGIEPEKTTVTKRDRRIFTFSETQMREAINVCEPNEIFLNFANYDKVEANRILELFPNHIRYMGYGAARNEVQDIW